MWLKNHQRITIPNDINLENSKIILSKFDFFLQDCLTSLSGLEGASKKKSNLSKIGTVCYNCNATTCLNHSAIFCFNCCDTVFSTLSDEALALRVNPPIQSVPPQTQSGPGERLEDQPTEDVLSNQTQSCDRLMEVKQLHQQVDLLSMPLLFKDAWDENDDPRVDEPVTEDVPREQPHADLEEEQQVVQYYFTLAVHNVVL